METKIEKGNGFKISLGWWLAIVSIVAVIGWGTFFGTSSANRELKKKIVTADSTITAKSSQLSAMKADLEAAKDEAKTWEQSYNSENAMRESLCDSITELLAEPPTPVVKTQSSAPSGKKRLGGK